MALKRGIVELVPFDDNWAQEYEQEEKLLKEVLKDYILEIHHVGSTSIKGLCAKPVIDILVVIKSLKDIPKIEDILKNYDYENRGPQGVEDRMFFAKGPEDARTHYLHFTEKGSKTYYDQIIFKKYLIEHPEYIQKYADLKKELAKLYKDERPKYTKGKNDFITEVIKKGWEEYDKSNIS